MHIRRQLILPLLALFVTVSSPLFAQAERASPSLAGGMTLRQFETREQLESQARLAEAQRRTSEAWLLRSRLQRGDFQEGDRIVVVLEAGGFVMDTLQVRSGKALHFPRMGELSLAGVLRSELTDTVRSYLAHYLTRPVVRVTPLLPVGVVGSVVQPGFYYLPADIVLRDVIMKAGGPVSDADLNKMVVRRNGDVIWEVDDVRAALTDGISLDGLHLRAGDELFVPRRRQIQSTTVVAFISSALALTMAIVNFTSR